MTMASMLEKEFSLLCFLMRDRNFLEEENFEIGIRIDSIDFFINCFIVAVLKKKKGIIKIDIDEISSSSFTFFHNYFEIRCTFDWIYVAV